MDYYVYILFSSKDQKFYIGYTTDLKSRVQQHLGGKVASTRNRRPLCLIFSERYINKKDAQRREKYLKSSVGKRMLRLILKETLIGLKEQSRRELVKLLH